MSHSKNTLFAEDSDESGTEEKEWKVNNSYAQNYKQWRRKEEIIKLKSRFGEDAELSDDSETSDDEFVEPDNPEFERDFLFALGTLKQNDKKALQDGTSFFKNSYGSGNKKQEEKPMTIKDYERHIIMNRDGKFDDDDDVEEEPGFSGNISRRQVASEFDDGGVSSGDEDDLLTSGLFKVKNQEQTDKNESKDTGGDLALVKDEVLTVDKKEHELLTGLKDAWTNPNNSKKEKWLADFFLNKRYLDEEDESIERAYNEAVIDEETISDDEETVAKMEDFETKYRFRYEEPDQDFIKHHPRNVPESMRQKDERRKEKREEIKKRKEEDLERKRQEIQQLKALKLQEIQEKIQKIKEVSGNDDIGDQILSDDDFDPDKHDSQMAKIYGGDYYDTNEDGDEKPVFEDDEIYENYDEWLEKEGKDAAGGGKLGEGEAYTEEDEEIYFENDKNFNMDCDYDPSQESLQEEIKASTSKRKGRKKSKFAKALAKKKPVFNPDEKNFDSYFEEYYKLDFEDVVGGVPCRFKYRKVEANNFGLTTEEILSAKDKELNRWFPVRKMVRYGRSEQEELKDRNNYKNRASQMHVKQKIMPSLFVENPEENHIEEEERKRLKNQKKKLKRLEKQKLAEIMAQNEEGMEENLEEKQNVDTECKSKKKKIKDTSTETEHDAQDEEGIDEPKRKKKRRIDNNNEDANDLIPSNDEVKKNMKKKKKKRDNASTESDIIETNIAEFQAQNNKVSEVSPSKLEQSVPTNSKSEKKQKKKKKINNASFHANNSIDGLDGISDARLLAYGANPKKIKSKVKYGKKKDM
ncbi:unnamed protein product, partial [Meganyctiphanes norvegica]